MLFKQTSLNWNRVSSASPSTITIADVHIVYQNIGSMIVFASGTDDIDETILAEVLVTIGKIFVDILENKVNESTFLVAENYGKFVISIDDMMPQGIIETLDASLIGKLSKLKAV